MNRKGDETIETTKHKLENLEPCVEFLWLHQVLLVIQICVVRNTDIKPDVQNS
jgi:hypothetical protein